MATPINTNQFRAFDANGDPVSGAKAYFYQKGTTTPVTVYQDEAETTPHATPVVADGNGVFADIYYTGAAEVKLTVTDADGVALDGYPKNVKTSFAPQDPDNVDIGGGEIDGTPIGANSASTGAFTTLSATGAVTFTGSVTGATGRLINVQVFTTAGAATYTKTAGTKYAYIILQGAGGGGGSADSDDAGNADFGVGAGGNAGQRTEAWIDVSGIATATLAIGAGGAGGASAGASGTQGGDTTYADGVYSWQATGGEGGAGRQDVGGASAVGGPARSSTSNTGVLFDIPTGGGGGGFGVASAAITGVGGVISGKGGDSLFGHGGRSVIQISNGAGTAGTNGNGFGSGGSGGATLGQTTAVAGGDGADGCIIIYEYSE